MSIPLTFTGSVDTLREALLLQRLRRRMSDTDLKILDTVRALIRDHRLQDNITEELSERPRRILQAAGLTTYLDVMSMTSGELLALTNFSAKDLDEVIAKLTEHGYILFEL